jgi:hypothetical protein
MAFPDVEAQKNKPGLYYKGDDGNWHCEKCEFVTESYASVLGHQGKHSTRPRKLRDPNKPRKTTGRLGNLRGKDPMKMTVLELIDTINELRAALYAAEAAGADAIAWQTKMQTLFAKAVPSEDDTTA